MTDTPKTNPPGLETQPDTPHVEEGSLEEQPQQGWAPKRSKRNTILFGAVILLGALAALYAWGLPPFGSSNETTDNAYVRGQTTIITPATPSATAEMRKARTSSPRNIAAKMTVSSGAA